MSKKIGLLIGSLRAHSYSRSIANALIELAPETLRLQIVESGDLPLYNQDLDDNGTPPESWQRFRKEIQALDGFIFITPEYNRSVPAVLKNALDVGSRPYGQSVWNGKPGAILSLTPGTLGGFGANHHLRQSMVFLNVLLLQQPEVYLSRVDTLLDEDGKLNDASTKDFLRNYLNAFSAWVFTLTK